MANSSGSTDELAIIGKLPGYNQEVDSTGYFSKILLRDITYIDLYPAIYSANLDFLSGKSESNLNNIYLYKSGLDVATPLKIFQSALKKIGNYTLSKWENACISYNQEIAGFKYYGGEGVGQQAIKEFMSNSAIRILAANDSTFTETISNNYSDSGALEQLSQNSANFLGEKLGSNLLSNGSMIGNVQKLSYESALKTLTSFSQNGSFMDVISGKILGIQFSSPRVWQESNYASTLSLFIKLASPSGSPVDVLRHITLPIMTLMAAGSPLTVNGVTYGMPLIWDVRAYGITRFKVGAIAAMTISRGNYETVFNYDKQPLVVDVRINIIPLVQDFAVQYDKNDTNGLFNDFSGTISAATKTLDSGASNQLSSLFKQTLGFAQDAQKGNDTLNTLFSSLNDIFSTVTKATKAITAINPQDYYSSNGLGVQSPGDELDGLFGMSSASSVDAIDPKKVSPVKPETHYFVI